MSSGGPILPTGRERLGRAGFETGSDVYERARPSYPDEAVAHLVATTGISGGSRVLDLAAGTGKLTRQLQAHGAVCLAVEPSASMREVFRRTVPGVAAAGGTAERIPAADATMDAVVVGQAFHWFDPSRALPEAARVLRPGGWLALIWNERDEADPAMAELVRISKWDRSAPYPVGMDFGTVIDRSNLFGPVERTKYPFVQRLDLTTFVEQVASRSYVQVLPDRVRRDLLAQVASFGATLGDPIAMPYITDLFCAQVAR
ncbi:MAG TPA: class I SAM-dependent methyltransferase [Acidimicrobiales bacterium]|jgi:SAM-dependent methyltransferase|nr:class I SAM-dependent methyltransferase [Acidimicrobiales bacterium]